MNVLSERILVEVDLEQKGVHSFKGANGEDLVLYNVKKYNPNGREANNVVCKVVSVNTKEYGYIKKGDTLAVHHNFFEMTGGYLIKKDIGRGKALFTIPVGRNLFGKILKDGTLQPICHNILVERVQKKAVSSIIIMPDSYKNEYETVFKVTVASKEALAYGIKVGDLITTFKKSDYEVCYNYNNVDYVVVKVWKEDVLALTN